MTQYQKTRILYVNHTGLVSGAERVLLAMLQVLDRTQYEPYVLCPVEGGLTGLVEKLEVPCIAMPPLEARFTLRPDRLLRYAQSLWRTVLIARKTIQGLDPEVIHANTLRAGVVATLGTTGTGRNVLWHLHDILPRHPVSTLIRLIACTSSRTRMVAVSHSVARAFCGNFSFSGRVETIYNGTDLSCFPPKAAGSSVFRQEAGIPDDAFLVCAVGQICVRKGLLELVNAFATIYAEVPLMHLAIVGKVVFAHEEEYQKVLIRTAITAGVADRVHFMGERKDVSSILQASDLLVLNSREEPFGLVLVEAMASGTPVLATRVGGVPEVVRDSENGWLIESGDTGALAAKLLELSQHVDQLDQAARFAREFTCPQFSIERFRRNLHRLYAELGDEAASKSNPRALTALTPHEGEKGVSDA